MEDKRLVLYRKYRPKTFSEVIGQEHIVKTLTNAIVHDRVSHAYLFYGPRGTGKTTIARLLAKAVNCENRKKGAYEPCNKCDSCREINEGKSLDLIEIDAASNRGIDEIRELKSGINFTPVKSKYKVFIIDEAHQLTKEAANALLKVIEEPPPYVIFILATTEIHKMIPTIVSRCQKFNFKRLTTPQIVKQLKYIAEKEKIKISRKALELIAIESEGSIRDAESILDQIITFSSFGEKKEIEEEDVRDILGLIETSLISEFVSLLLKKKMRESLEYLQKVVEQGYDIKVFLDAILEYLREGIFLKINPELKGPFPVAITKEEVDKLREEVKNISEEDLRKMIDILLEAEAKMRYSPIPQLPLELAIVEICGVV